MIKSAEPAPPVNPPVTPRQERFLLAIMWMMLYTHIIDFMIVMPLAPRLMGIFAISPSQFGWMVSAYMFSAGLSGLVAAWFLDRFDRKVALLWLYVGFGLGTLACGLAPSYAVLLAARILTGAFGGVMGAVVLAIVADVIPPQRRGAAMGTIFSSFSIAAATGVPIGLLLANLQEWHLPFLIVAGLCVVFAVLGGFALPSLRGHMAQADGPRPWQDMKAVLGHGNHWRAFALTMVMSGAGFLLIPYISAYLVANAGVSNEQLFWVYAVAGGTTFFTMKYIGRLSDRLGQLKVFTGVSLIALLPMLAISRLPPVPLWAAVAATTAFMVFVAGRMVPGMAMVSSAVEPRYRGGFMSINSSVQQFASGLAAMISGAILVKAADGRLERYGLVGILAAASVLLSLVLARRLRAEEPGAGPPPAPRPPQAAGPAD